MHLKDAQRKTKESPYTLGRSAINPSPAGEISFHVDNIYITGLNRKIQSTRKENFCRPDTRKLNCLSLYLGLYLGNTAYALESLHQVALELLKKKILISISILF